MSEQSRTIFSTPLAHADAQEKAPRISGPFAALVRGKDVPGRRFEVETELDDLSASDCNLRLQQEVREGSRLLVVARLHKALVAMHSVVLKASPQEDGLWCLSLEIINNRFLTRKQVHETQT
jgi:hypothetical protein